MTGANGLRVEPVTILKWRASGQLVRKKSTFGRNSWGSGVFIQVFSDFAVLGALLWNLSILLRG